MDDMFRCLLHQNIPPLRPARPVIKQLLTLLLMQIPVTVGRNQPLKKERPSWTSELPLTEGQLRSKRDEFWETAPAFEGRKEIWDALRAAAETSDHTLAQAIVDGANITLPTGESVKSHKALVVSRQILCCVLWTTPFFSRIKGVDNSSIV